MIINNKIRYLKSPRLYNRTQLVVKKIIGNVIELTNK